MTYLSAPHQQRDNTDHRTAGRQITGEMQDYGEGASSRSVGAAEISAATLRRIISVAPVPGGALQKRGHTMGALPNILDDWAPSRRT